MISQTLFNPVSAVQSKNRLPNRGYTTYHSHTNYCDGQHTIEEFVKGAIERGFTAYGISSHAPLPSYIDYHAVLQPDKVQLYIAEVELLRRKYADQIELYIAMEIDYIDKDFGPASDYFQSLPLDYRIGAVHFMKVGSKQVMDVDTVYDKFSLNLQRYYNGNLRELVRDYFDAKMKMISAGGIDFVAHCDKVSMNAARAEPGVTQQSWYREMSTEYFRFIAEQGVMIEINTKSFERKEHLFFPNQEHWKLLCEIGIPLVVNSDVHRLSEMTTGLDYTRERLKTIGYKTLREFHQGRWQEVEI